MTPALPRQRNDLLLVAGHQGETAGAPILLRLRNALRGGRHEVPPDVARSVHRCSAQQDEPRGRRGADGDAIAWPEHEQPSVAEPVAGNVDLARGDVKGALLV